MAASLYGFLSGLGYTHPLHPLFVHVTVGLVVAAFIFGITSVFFHKEALSRSAHYSIILALVFWVPSLVFGLGDWYHFYGGVRIFPIMAKLVLAPILLVLLVAAMVFGFRRARGLGTVRFLYTLTLLTAIGIGFFGGELVYGRKSPALESRLKGGEKIFLSFCGGCHPGGGNVLKPGKPLAGGAQLGNFKSFLAFLRKPGAGMPAFPAVKIPEEQARELYEYLLHQVQRGDWKVQKNR
jgi:uncharacterized membrane protein